MQRSTNFASHARRRGFSLVELLVAMGIGLFFVIAVMSAYLSSQNAFKRTEEVSALQNAARTAFEYMGFDARQAGMLGCQMNGDKAPVNQMAANLLTDYLVPVQGFDAVDDPDYKATDITTVSKWSSNQTGSGGQTSIAFNSTGTGLPNGAANGSDVLILRGPTVSMPVRLTETANTGTATTTAKVEVLSNSATSCASGVCANSHALITNCSDARVVQVSGVNVSGNVGTLTLASPGMSGAGQFQTDRSEVFPLQTIVYYVGAGSNTSSLSLYRQTFNGTSNAGTREELIEGVETMQITYGYDKTPARDYSADDYLTADSVEDWSRVMSIRISLLMRPTEPLRAGFSSAASAAVNDITTTFPDKKYDRRVFTTTVALRNRVPYAPYSTTP